MSLVKSPRMTEKKLAASRRNGKVSKGATTPEGLKRIRMANMRRGFCSQSEKSAFLVLGEDAGEFSKMREEFLREWHPAEGLQRRLVERLARAVWRAERADRMQEGQAMRLAKEVNKIREDRLHAQMMRLKLTSETLQKLAESVAQWHYVTTPKHLESVESFYREGDIAVTIYLSRLCLVIPSRPGFLGQCTLGQRHSIDSSAPYKGGKDSFMKHIIDNRMMLSRAQEGPLVTSIEPFATVTAWARIFPVPDSPAGSARRVFWRMAYKAGGGTIHSRIIKGT